MKVKCPLCNFTTDDAAKLAGHLFSCHTEPGSTKFAEPGKQEREQEQTIYECQFCGKTFKTYQEAQKHVLQEHREQLEQLAAQKQAEKARKTKKAKKSSSSQSSPQKSS